MDAHDGDSIGELLATMATDVAVASASVLVAGDGDEAATLSDTLVREGYTVTRVHDGWAALDHLRQWSADVALIEQSIGGLGGVDVCRLVKRDPGTRLVPVMLLLPDSAPQDQRLKGIEAGVDELVSPAVDVQELTARVRSLVRMKRYTDDLELVASVMITLATMIEARDGYTEGHCHRMANHAAALGRQLGLHEDEIEALRQGGFLHDIGMLAVPDAVIQKPTSLTPDERAMVRSHTVIGESLISNLRSLQPVRAIVRHHHERRDGSGYPDGLRRDEIPVAAQIVGLIDVFEALTSPRPYQKIRSSEEALVVLRGQVAQGWHRRDLLDAFTDIVHAE